MIGLRQLYTVDQRLRQIFLEHQNRYFGGRSVILMGNFFQLPPIAERALYNKQPSNQLKAAKLAGRLAYLAFNKTIELKVVVRQQGDKQAAFRDALEGLRNNNPTYT